MSGYPKRVHTSKLLTCTRSCSIFTFVLIRTLITLNYFLDIAYLLGPVAAQPITP